MNFSKDLFYPFLDTFICAYTSLKELLHIDSLTFHAGKSVKRKQQLMFLIHLMQLVIIDQVWSVPMIRGEHMYNRYTCFVITELTKWEKKKEGKHV